MKKFMLLSLVVLVAFTGCSSPAADYVRAEKAAWDEFDRNGNLDRWVDQEPTFSDDAKDALHQLNVGRRARVAHAIAAIGS